MTPAEIKEFKKDLLALRNLASRALDRVEIWERSTVTPLTRTRKAKREKVTPEDHIRRIITRKYKI